MAIGVTAWAKASHWRLHPHVYDDAHVLPVNDREALEDYIGFVRQESGVDLWFVFTPSTAGVPIEQFALQRARELGVGQSTNRRGALFVYDVAGRHLRIEVGPGLEHVFTDAFTGYLARGQLQPLFDAKEYVNAIKTLVMITQDRIRQSMLGEGFNTDFLTYIEDRRRLAAGGGATTGVDTTAGRSGLTNGVVTAKAKAYFTPQPTVEAAFQRYLDWCAQDSWQPDVPLFTRASQDWLFSLPMTRYYMGFMMSHEYAAAHAIDQRDSLALLYFTADPLAGPHFFRRTPEGWRMDIVAEVSDTRNYVGGPYSWGMLDNDDDFTRTFGDRYIDAAEGYVLRLAGADNRELPRQGNPPPPPLAHDAGVERLTTAELGHLLMHTSGTTLFILYNTRGPRDQQTFAAFATLAREAEGLGVRVVAAGYNDDDSEAQLRAFIAAHGAGVTPRLVYQWRTGQLRRGLEPTGVRIGPNGFDNPIVAVLAADGSVAYQADGVMDYGPVRTALAKALANSGQADRQRH